VIWTDQDKNNGIHVADLATGKKMRGILHPPFGQANDVISYDKAQCYFVYIMSMTYCKKSLQIPKG
jgi:hypothetical protein